MADISYNKIRESEFDDIVSKRDNFQDLNINQLNLEVHDTYKKDQKITTNFEPTDDSDVLNKVYLDDKLKKWTVLFHILKKITTNSNYNTTNNL